MRHELDAAPGVALLYCRFTADLLPIYCGFTAAFFFPLLQVCMQLHGVRYADVTSEAEARGRLRAGAFALLRCCCCLTAALQHLLLLDCCFTAFSRGCVCFAAAALLLLLCCCLTSFAAASAAAFLVLYCCFTAALLLLTIRIRAQRRLIGRKQSRGLGKSAAHKIVGGGEGEGGGGGAATGTPLLALLVQKYKH